MIETQNDCNISTCRGNETLREVTRGALVRGSHMFDLVYIVGKTLADVCGKNSTEKCADKLGSLIGKRFFNAMQANKINLDGFDFKFSDNSGKPFYDFYQYQKTNHRTYEWIKIGQYFDGKIDPWHEKNITHVAGPTECAEVFLNRGRIGIPIPIDSL